VQVELYVVMHTNELCIFIYLLDLSGMPWRPLPSCRHHLSYDDCLYCVVHNDMHTHEQFLKLNVGFRFSFWATVCKTAHPILLDHCRVLSCLSVTSVYCGQTVGWIKMKLGVQVGLGPSHIVLDGDPAPTPKRCTAPNFPTMSVVAKWLDGLRCYLVWR